MSRDDEMFQSPCGEVVVKEDGEPAGYYQLHRFQSPCGEVVVKVYTLEDLSHMTYKEFQSPCGEVVVKGHQVKRNPYACYKVSVPLRGSGGESHLQIPAHDLFYLDHVSVPLRGSGGESDLLDQKTVKD